MRTTIYLRDDQVASLAEFCRREGISRAEAVRRAMALYVKDYAAPASREQRDAAIHAAFGLWKDRGIDTDAYIRELREEWDDRERGLWLQRPNSPDGQPAD